MKERYERPSIQRQLAAQMNPLGHIAAPSAMTAIESVPVSDLIAQHGSPLFVFSERSLRHQYRAAHRAFTVRYPKVQLAWSYKTNYLQSICAIFHQEGAWAEVVSEFEYEMARRQGIAGPHIIFNGPFKSKTALRRAVTEEAIINLDCADELESMLDIAESVGRPLAVGLRINLDAGLLQSWSRFGFNLENGEAHEAIRLAVESGKLTIRGLHCHIGTFILDPEIYRRQAKKLTAFTQEIEANFGVELNYLDLGGGFASTNTLHAQYLTGEQITPSFDQYAEAICSELLVLQSRPAGLPLLILESGRALVDEAGSLIATVVATKTLPNGIRGIVLDVGLNALYTATWYRHQIIPAQNFSGFMEETVVYGPLCMNIDVVRDTVMLPPIGLGDRLVIKPVGAYNTSQWMQWIQARPAVVLISEQGEVDLIRERETIDDLAYRERMPGRLGQSRPA